jgi:hypothetical protein
MCDGHDDGEYPFANAALVPDDMDTDDAGSYDALYGDSTTTMDEDMEDSKMRMDEDLQLGSAQSPVDVAVLV